MGQITTNAIVLRRVDYRENDRMLTLFSPTLGRIDALCRARLGQKVYVRIQQLRQYRVSHQRSSLAGFERCTY